VRFRVSFRPLAEADLRGLYDYIADKSGLDVAGRYIDRIESACLALRTFPKRGRDRSDIEPGLRTVGFERRATILFKVVTSEVVIIRILYGGQDFERLLRPSSQEDAQ
jgi:toxin ParE1/3/4